MIERFEGCVAVITGAASGFGLEAARMAARHGMRVVLADIEAAALERAAAEVAALGAEVLPHALDVSKGCQVEALAAATLERFGTPHLLFNNAGVGLGGLVWEHSAADWEWAIGVNLMGVAHGVRVFVPLMLAAAAADPAWRGHVVNTASMAGLVNMPNMGAYNVSKHAVVSLSETLLQDLRLVTSQIGASVLCPYFVPTGIGQSARNRPPEVAGSRSGTDTGTGMSTSQRIAREMIAKAVQSGKVSASDVVQRVFDAVREDRFYIFSHPHALSGVQSRLEDILQQRNPSDPFAARPEIGRTLREALRGDSSRESAGPESGAS